MATVQVEQDLSLDESPDEINTDKLQFQDISHSSGLGGPDAHGGMREQTHNFTSFPNQEDSDDEDKSELLQGEKKQLSFWTFEYYQQFFDVDTWQVVRRVIGSMFPHPRRNYLQTQIRPNPDMYGPFWICTTLVFTTAIAGNMANYIQHAGTDYQWVYDFHKVTFAAVAIFCYWLLIPSMLYLLLRWRGNTAGFMFLEMICVYGYSLAIYIPISILWVVQYNWFQWLLVLIGTGLSGSVLLMTFWPAVKEDDKKVAGLTMAGILLFHLLLAVGFVLYFFHVPDHHLSPTDPTTTMASLPEAITKALTNATRAL